MTNLIKKLSFLLLIIMCFMNTQCEDDDIVIDNLCDYTTIVNETEYNNATSEGLTIINANIEGDCLSIKIGASGCSGSSWVFKLIDSGAVAESSPEQRYLKLDFSNKELCQAYFERTVSFRLDPVRVEGSQKIILHIAGLDQALEYSY